MNHRRLILRISTTFCEAYEASSVTRPELCNVSLMTDPRTKGVVHTVIELLRTHASNYRIGDGDSSRRSWKKINDRCVTR